MKNIQLLHFFLIQLCGVLDVRLRIHSSKPRICAFLNSFSFLLSAFLLSSCATSPALQGQLSYHLATNQYSQALYVLENQPDQYGSKNRLLYLYDYGMTLHYAGRYKESIAAFEKAKVEYERLYTKSVSEQSLTWLVNDLRASYRGEDYERVMLSIMQALNFAAIGDFESMAVEARHIDRILNIIHQKYTDVEKILYNEDAFARFLSGLGYELAGYSSFDDEAWLDYKTAWTVYEKVYQDKFDVGVPTILKQNMADLSHRSGFKLEDHRQKELNQIQSTRQGLKEDSAQVYLVHHHGASPEKYQDELIFPTPDGYLVKLAFPSYQKPFYVKQKSKLRALDFSGNQITEEQASVVQDIGQIAIDSLQQRKKKLMVKGVMRAIGKYALERTVERSLDEDHQNEFRYIVSAYNFFSEQADLRAWKSLPGQIRMSRLVLKPGEYELFFNDKSLGKHSLKQGEVKFFMERTLY